MADETVRLRLLHLGGSMGPVGLVGIAGAGLATATITGQGADMYHKYKLAEGIADEQQAEYEAQLKAQEGNQQQASQYANGEGIDESTGMQVDPESGLEYDEAKGWPEDGIAPGTRWDDIPDDWSCPDCGAAKSDFVMVEVARP